MNLGRGGTRRRVAIALPIAAAVGLIAAAPPAIAGDGGFTQAAGSPLGAGTDPFAVAVGDFNSDGDEDLAVANAGSDNVSVLTGGPGASFVAATPVAVGDDPRSIAVGDFNGDGDEDLAVGNTGSTDSLSVLLGGSGASFTPAAGSPIAVGFPKSIAVGDFDGNGIEDLVVAGGASSVTVFTGTGAASFTTATVASGLAPWGVAVGDFNADGDEDLAVTNHDENTVRILTGGAGTSFAAAGSLLPVGTFPVAIAVGDFNGDGDEDLAVANRGSPSSLTVLTGGAGATFSFNPPPTVGTSPNWLVVGDFNSDGDDDLAIANADSNNVSVATGGAGASFAAAAGSPVTVGNGPFWVAAGDFDSDGNQDLATANIGTPDNVSVLTGTGTPWQADNLLTNGGTEGAGAATTTAVSPAPFGWTQSGPLTYVRYGTAGDLPRIADSARWEGGLNFFAGGPANAASSATQTIDVTANSASIDAGLATVRLAARLGGYRDSTDRMGVTASFLNASNAVLGTIAIGPVTAADRNNRTVLLTRAQTAAVPTGTRKIAVRLDATRGTGSPYNDGYADDVELNLTAPAPPVITPPATDTDPPETTIDKGPKKKSTKRKVKIVFSSDEPGSSFECKLDKANFKSCSSPFKAKVKVKGHSFQVRAIDPAANVDPTPEELKFKVLKKK